MTQSTFKIVTHRHDPQTGQGRFKTDFLNTSDFAAAFLTASWAVVAMQEADPKRIYKLASISQEGFRGEETAVGWLTSNELAAKGEESE